MAVGLDRGEFRANGGRRVVVRQISCSGLRAKGQKVSCFPNRHPVASESTITTAEGVHGIEFDAEKSASKLAAYGPSISTSLVAASSHAAVAVAIWSTTVLSSRLRW